MVDTLLSWPLSQSTFLWIRKIEAGLGFLPSNFPHCGGGGSHGQRLSLGEIGALLVVAEVTGGNRLFLAGEGWGASEKG